VAEPFRAAFGAVHIGIGIGAEMILRRPMSYFLP